MFTVQMIEYAAYLYLRTLSLNATVEIFQTWFSKEVLSKDILLKHILKLIDNLPSYGEVTQIFKPQRSGYYAFDGLWFKYLGKNLVLLICFDAETLDIIHYQIAEDEGYSTWKKLFEIVERYEPELLLSAKGFMMDGELGLMKLLKETNPNTPKQLCVFHKYTRVGQIIPLKRVKGVNLEIKQRVEKVLFASTKQKAISSLIELKRYAQEHQENKKLREIVGVLKHNFDLLLTHFDNPEMSPYNNVLEGANHLIKRKLRLTKGFKKRMNVDKWLKLILLDYRFHKVKTSKFKFRNGNSPLELAGVNLPKHFNWMRLVRKKSN